MRDNRESQTSTTSLLINLSNPYEINEARRRERLHRHIRMCEIPSNRTESAVQNVAKKLVEEYNWTAR